MTAPFFGEVMERRLENGLHVAVLRTGHAALVATVLWYRVGSAREERGRGGIAHFLEHMMFKGSSAYGPGEVDRLTQALGGANNAFTSHDATVYHFQLAADCWQEALHIEADRMAGLLLDEVEVEHERRVICEEIAMYDSDPWDSLEDKVRGVVFGDHPYGRSVLGTAGELAAIGRADLAAFHSRHYVPSAAVLVVAGAVDEEALETAVSIFGGLSPGEPPPPCGASPPPGGALRRLEMRHGEVSRMIWSLPAPAWGDPRHPPLRLLAQLLTEGRASLLHRSLVEERKLCSWVSSDLDATLEPGSLSIACELVPGAQPEAVEEELFALLAAALAAPPAAAEIERAKRTFEADWILGHERIHQRASSLACALAHFDVSFPATYIDRLLHTSREELVEVAREILHLDRGVVGWSRPASASLHPSCAAVAVAGSGAPAPGGP